MKITLIANNITFSDIQQSRQRNKEFKSGKTNESFFLKKKLRKIFKLLKLVYLSSVWQPTCSRRLVSTISKAQMICRQYVFSYVHFRHCSDLIISYRRILNVVIFTLKTRNLMRSSSPLSMRSFPPSFLCAFLFIRPWKKAQSSQVKLNVSKIFI